LTWQQRLTMPYRQPPRSRCSSSERRRVEGARHAGLRQSTAAAGRCALQLADANCSTPAAPSVVHLCHLDRLVVSWASARKGADVTGKLSGCPAQSGHKSLIHNVDCILQQWLAHSLGTPLDTLVTGSFLGLTSGHCTVHCCGLQQVLHTVRASLVPAAWLLYVYSSWPCHKSCNVPLRLMPLISQSF
jgi:hypothetical protein